MAIKCEQMVYSGQNRQYVDEWMKNELGSVSAGGREGDEQGSWTKKKHKPKYKQTENRKKKQKLNEK